MVLEQQGKPVSFAYLCDLLDIHKNEETSFERRLGAMEREGQPDAQPQECLHPARTCQPDRRSGREARMAMASSSLTMAATTCTPMRNR